MWSLLRLAGFCSLLVDACSLHLVVKVGYISHVNRPRKYTGLHCSHKKNNIIDRPMLILLRENKFVRRLSLKDPYINSGKKF